MFFVNLSLSGWLAVMLIAALLAFTPFFVVAAVAEQLSEPLRTIVFVVGNYIAVPALVSYLYAKKLRNTGRGTAIFWLYCGFFALLFAVSVSHLFSKPLSLETILGPFVTGGVTVAMVLFAWRTRHRARADTIDQYEVEREEAIRRQAEAILLAEEMKKANESS